MFLEIFGQAVFPQERDTVSRVEVILVFGWLFGFRLDVEWALEPDFLLVVDRHVQKKAQMVKFP